MHWAAVLMGIPRLIGTLDNPARDVVDAGAALILDRLACPVLCLNMVYTEDEQHRAVPRGLFAGWGLDGFQVAALALGGGPIVLSAHPLSRRAARPSPCSGYRRCMTRSWTAGKGSYKLQRPGVLAPGGEIVLFAPHIHAFHSNPVMDASIRRVGYHGAGAH